MDNQQPSRKVCTQCGVSKPLEQFWFNKARQRHVAACRSCTAQARERWKERNAERVREINRAWQRANPDRVRAAQLRWRGKNPGVAAQRSKEWYERNKEHARKRDRGRQRQFKDAAYQAYGGYVCGCCGETTEAFLSLDHVNNDGSEHRKVVDRRKIYYWLAENNYPPGFQVLCMNCNFGKARNGGVCPHQTEGSTTRARARRPKRAEARSPRNGVKI